MNYISLDNKFMKMILIILFLSEFWLSTLNLKNGKHLKGNKWRINARSVFFWKMMGFFCVIRCLKIFKSVSHKNLNIKRKCSFLKINFKDQNQLYLNSSFYILIIQRMRLVFKFLSHGIRMYFTILRGARNAPS